MLRRGNPPFHNGGQRTRRRKPRSWAHCDIGSVLFDNILIVSTEPQVAGKGSLSQRVYNLAYRFLGIRTEMSQRAYVAIRRVILVETSRMRRPTMHAVVSPQGPNTLSNYHRHDKRKIVSCWNTLIPTLITRAIALDLCSEELVRSGGPAAQLSFSGLPRARGISVCQSESGPPGNTCQRCQVAQRGVSIAPRSPLHLP